MLESNKAVFYSNNYTLCIQITPPLQHHKYSIFSVATMKYQSTTMLLNVTNISSLSSMK